MPVQRARIIGAKLLTKDEAPRIAANVAGPALAAAGPCNHGRFRQLCESMWWQFVSAMQRGLYLSKATQ
jgi:hypothetical protein